MPMSDVVIAGNDGAGRSFVEDRWITDGRTPDNVVYDVSQDITDTSATRTAGVLTITFSRSLNLIGHTFRDISLANRCVWVLWAYGGTVDFSAAGSHGGVFGLTGHSAKGVFPQQLCSGTATPIPTPNGSMTIVMSLGVILLGALIATFATY